MGGVNASTVPAILVYGTWEMTTRFKRLHRAGMHAEVAQHAVVVDGSAPTTRTPARTSFALQTFA
jgi:6,7-dimethyl-8-ribityllumazine synthase